MDGDAVAGAFEQHRSRLKRIAYRMLGSVAEAEDVVQDAFLRWHRADREHVRDPGAFLARTVARLSLDVLKSARVKREAYVGAWLPEPILVAEEEPAEDVTFVLMMALERLSPLERAAFLLHDVFGMDFPAVAEAIGRDEPACRQLASRARRHVREARPRYAVDRQRGLAIAGAFLVASRSGDTAQLKELLAADVVVLSDGGGQAHRRAQAGDRGGQGGAILRPLGRAGGLPPRSGGPFGTDRRPARLCHRGTGRPAGDRPRNSRWPHRGDLRGAQPRKAPTSGRAGRPPLTWRPPPWHTAPLTIEQREAAVDRTEINKLQDYLRRKFGNQTIKLQPNMRRKEMVEVMIGDEQIGTLYKDVDEGETSYTVTISILDVDLEEE